VAALFCRASGAAGRKLILLAVLLLAPAEARAEWLVMPFFGLKLFGSTTFFSLEQAESETTVTFGGSVGWLGSGIVGVEGDFGFVPNYFELGDRPFYSGSYVVNLSGNVILTTPISVTREGLRPYIVGGFGWLRASADDLQSTFDIRSNMPAVTVGGGALGMLSRNTGVRFDLRYLWSLGHGDQEEQADAEGPRLSFFRASVAYVRSF
jgi:hypothetical protein